MTLPRTIHRRNARKRAKLRPKPKPGFTFFAPEWVTHEMMNRYFESLAIGKAFSRDYDR